MDLLSVQQEAGIHRTEGCATPPWDSFDGKHREGVYRAPQVVAANPAGMNIKETDLYRFQALEGQRVWGEKRQKKGKDGRDVRKAEERERATAWQMRMGDVEQGRRKRSRVKLHVMSLLCMLYPSEE